MHAAALTASIGAIALLCGCDLTTRIAANETSAVLRQASHALEEHWDVDLVGAGLPGSILQLEGIYAVIPDDELMGIEVIRANGSYAWGWLENDAEDALARGDLEQQEAIALRMRKRAKSPCDSCSCIPLGSSPTMRLAITNTAAKKLAADCLL